jgi:dipeptidyl aminopeptidase/acylaminoacyl peptidase
MKKIIFPALIALVSLAFTCAAQTANTPLKPEQIVEQRGLSEAQISPDGERVAFTVTEPPKGATRNSNIWIFNTRTRDLRRFTTATKRDYSPRWSPAGQTLAFLSNRDGATQIYLLTMDGGEAVKLTDSKSAIESLAWSPDGRRIAFTAAEPATEDEDKKQEAKDDARVVDKDDKPTRLWMIDVGTRQTRQLTDGKWKVSEFGWLPSGNQLIVTATDKYSPEQFTNRIYSLDINSNLNNELREMFAPRGQFGDLKISPDGKSIAYINGRVESPIGHDLFVQAIAGGEPRNLTATALDRAIENYVWATDGSILAQVEMGFKTALYRVTVDGKATTVSGLETNPLSFDAHKSGTLALVGQTVKNPRELWIGDTRGHFTQVTNFNEKLRQFGLVEPLMLEYQSFDGLKIEAELFKPRDFREGARVPLIVLVHGGPTGRWADAFNSHYSAWTQLLVSRGYAVLLPNVRGSTGYGWQFLASNRGDWGGGDFKDILAGVDEVVRRGVADENRVGIGGWSYGGFMAMWAVTQTNRFKAAVAGAGLSDLAAEFGTEDDPTYDEWFYGTPYENLSAFQKNSPITFVKMAKTPTLILQGEADVVDPIGQSQQFYRGLKRYGVEAEFVVYPREGHGFREEKHIIDYLNRLLGWFDRYLKTGNEIK